MGEATDDLINWWILNHIEDDFGTEQSCWRPIGSIAAEAYHHRLKSGLQIRSDVSDLRRVIGPLLRNARP